MAFFKRNKTPHIYLIYSLCLKLNIICKIHSLSGSPDFLDTWENFFCFFGYDQGRMSRNILEVRLVMVGPQLVQKSSIFGPKVNIYLNT